LRDKKCYACRHRSHGAEQQKPAATTPLGSYDRSPTDHSSTPSLESIERAVCQFS